LYIVLKVYLYVDWNVVLYVVSARISSWI